MAIFGLMGTEQFARERFKNVRRQVLYNYPNGSAPLLGFLSLLKEQVSNDPEYVHYEKRLKEWRTNTPASGTVLSDNTAQPGTALGTGVNIVAGTSYQVNVLDTTQFRVGMLIWIKDVPQNTTVPAGYSPAVVQIKGSVTAISAQPGPGYLTFTALENYANIGAQSTFVNLNVQMVGTAYAQGSLSGPDAVYNLPLPFANACQIFRTPFSFTGTALKTAAKFDETGPYRDKAKESSLEHMISMEMAFLFGVYSKSVNSTTGLPTFTTGGLEWYLNQWEAGIYGNTAVAASAGDNDDNKRIINNVSGTMNEKFYDTLMERVFRVTNNKGNDKLCLCGSGYLNVIDQMYKSKINMMSKLPITDAYGMNIVEHQSPFGRIYYKTHPLFNQNPFLRYSAFILDVNNISYRYVNGRDTELLANRQPNDADYRRDEWMTEAGMEVFFPESHMYIKNVMAYNP